MTTEFFCPHCEQHHTQPIQKQRGSYIGLYCPICGERIKIVKKYGDEAQTATATTKTESKPGLTLPSTHADDCPFDEHETFSCKTCGAPTACYDKYCDRCWEVEHRLPDYLRSPKAWEFVWQHLPKLDDWKDGKPDAWDHEAVLQEHGVVVDDSDGLGWSLHWQQGTIHIGETTETVARKAAALFVSLWLRGVSASFADKLMDGYICFLERQEGKSLTFLAEIDHDGEGLSLFRLTREGLCKQATFTLATERKIIEALNLRTDEEVTITFTKRPRSGPWSGPARSPGC